MTGFYAQFVKPGALAFDIGAYHGSRTAAFRRLGARVIAVEPVKESVRTLFVRFHDDPLVTIVPRALGAGEGETSIALSMPYRFSSSLSPEYTQAAAGCSRYAERGVTSWREARPVRVTTLDALIRDFGVPLFTKIDVEGFEDAVLQGLSQPLPALSFEFHPHLPRPALRSIELLARRGRYCMNYVLEEQFRWQLDRWVTPREMIRILEHLPRHDQFLYGDVYARAVPGEIAVPATPA